MSVDEASSAQSCREGRIGARVLGIRGANTPIGKMSGVTSREDAKSILDELLREFRQVTGALLQLPECLREQAIEVLTHLDRAILQPSALRQHAVFYHINRKLRLNRDAISEVYGIAAAFGVTFNHNEKRAVEEAFDMGNATAYHRLVEAKRLPTATAADILQAFKPIIQGETLNRFKQECERTTNPRLKRVDAAMTPTMLEAVFAAYLFSSFPTRAIHDALDPLHSGTIYEVEFWRRLHLHNGHLFDRNNALWIASLDQATLDDIGSYEALRDKTLGFVQEAYVSLNNHCFLAIYIEPLREDGRRVSWELAADVVLFAEKFLEEELTSAFFQKEHICKATADYIGGLDVEAARFDLANDGFSYQDCFVLYADEQNQAAEPALLLLLQKHRRDETPIPCPACRSHEVQGNSYPTLGVRSWECQNYVCSDRSKSNRGKRYSFLSLLKQQAIDDPRNEVAASSVKAWMRDVRQGIAWDDALEMLVRHYSLAGDTVRVFNRDTPAEIAGRNVLTVLRLKSQDGRKFADFASSSFFHRFLVERPAAEAPEHVRILGDSAFRVLHGDAFHALRTLEAESIDGAVTSPPYYNAREYAQWNNIYCHIYDMYNIAGEVFRVLKPGALYLYNIFDYFDNENSISLSAMGKKRLALSAYTVYAFRKRGFALWSNVVWDKGDIEGKRGFNGGNFSPYYQSPFNCWEHVLVFAKPGPGVEAKVRQLPTYLRQKPVLKMVKGDNKHGHTAPFPDAIPGMLTEILEPGSVVLDPFAGSLTTGRVAERHGIESVCVERDLAYCQLGMKMRASALAQSSFFK